MKDEWCCGNPLLRTGQMTPAKEVAQHNLEQLKNAETVITACAECNRTLRIDYPKMGLEVPQVMHITEFLSGLLDEGKLKLEKPVNMKVTYHDPCYMSRRMDFGIYDEPRKLLSAIPGLELVEMENTRENTWCCGAGGAFKIAHPVEAVESGVDRLGHAVKVGAEVIVSSCPFCKANFVDAVKETESKLQVYDITELIAKSMGV
jgi:heterodisulfide reductase subunit D